jgi:SAM-dependent methyltransferase
MHVSPSVSLYIHNVMTCQIPRPNSVLDLGAGNGRNSLALAREFSCRTTLVDSDPKMLEEALSNFRRFGLNEPEVLHCRLEDLNSLNVMEGRTFDVLIASYVLHHVEPSYHQTIVQFCRTHVVSHLLIDVYWNRLRCAAGQYVKLPEAGWYGLTYEELAGQLAPHFKIESDRVMLQSRNMVFNLMCTPGSTSPEFLAERKFDYSMYDPVYRGRFQTTVRRPRGFLEKFECISRLAEAFPGEWELTKSAYENNSQDFGSLPIRLGKACRFLMACREHGFPVLLKEFEEVFRVHKKDLLRAFYENGPCKQARALGPEYFVQRIIRVAGLPTEVENLALSMLSQCKGGGLNPVVSAAAAVAVASRKLGIDVSKSHIGDILRVSPLAIRNRERILVGDSG